MGRFREVDVVVVGALILLSSECARSPDAHEGPLPVAVRFDARGDASRRLAEGLKPPQAVG